MTEPGSASTARPLPRLGFLGVGWIGRSRMEAVLAAGAAVAGAVADVDAGAAEAARAAAARAAAGTSPAGAGAPQAGASAPQTGAGAPQEPPHVCRDLEQLLDQPLDGVVIATPTALHAEQAAQVLHAGLPVFCQKPLGRTEAECRELVDLARRRDLRLGVDMSYRHLAAVEAIRARLLAGDIGAPHALELTFHNAYGPDRGWASQVALAGGGALIDLGCHLIDLAALLLGPINPMSVHADLYRGGRRLPGDPAEVEDLALAQLSLQGGVALRVACSWWHPAGQDAVIEATLTGSGGALRLANVGGSFYDFEAVRLRGAEREQLVSPPDAWSGRAIVAWARRLAEGKHEFDPGVESLVEVARIIDLIYGRDGAAPRAPLGRSAAGAAR